MAGKFGVALIIVGLIALVAVLLLLGGWAPFGPAPATPTPIPTPMLIVPEGVELYRLDADSVAYLEYTNNIYNLGVISNDPNVLKAEYEAGFMQGRLQKDQLAGTRDNLWDSAALTDASDFKQIPPTDEQKAQATRILGENYEYTVNYIRNADGDSAPKLKRVLFRLLGIYHGAAKETPEQLDFSGNWMPELSYFGYGELKMNYESGEVSFMDVYFINGYADVFYVIDDEEAKQGSPENPASCSAFVKKTEDDIFFAHNSWSSYIDQSMAQTYWVNGDFVTFNTLSPGMMSSNTDFGYNNKGVAFLETTHRATYTEPKTEALWMIWRAAVAEQFAGSLDEFYKYISLEASGTYLNGYIIFDDETDEIGLVEMSHKSFVYFKPDGNGGYEVITKPDGISKEYDHEMVQADYIIGINYPASFAIAEDLKAQDNRPSRKVQFLARKDSVVDIESAKALITYTDPENPLSIYGRWDLGYGNTPAPKTVPDGSVDAKAVSSSMTMYVYDLKGELDFENGNPGFWMRFGTPHVDGKPFIWSESQWAGQKLRGVPDAIDGNFTLFSTYIK